jgi:hypothetical protein
MGGEIAKPTVHFDHYHLLIARLLLSFGAVLAREAFTGTFHSHFGAIMEMTRCTANGFEKFPSATFWIELVKLAKNSVTLLGGNYLTYQYLGDLLVFRRFGQIRYDKLKEKFGTDQLISTIDSPHRQPTQKENEKAVAAIRGRSFDDATYNVFIWIDVDDPASLKTKVSQADPKNFYLREEGTRFVIFRSPQLREDIAWRFGKEKLIIEQ